MAAALQNATERSLVVVDEFGKGTDMVTINQCHYFVLKFSHIVLKIYFFVVPFIHESLCCLVFACMCVCVGVCGGGEDRASPPM